MTKPIEGLKESAHLPMGFQLERHWMEHGACLGYPPEIFFAPVNHTTEVTPGEVIETVEFAKGFCKGCPVEAVCLAYALIGEEDGTWGGTTYEERRTRPWLRRVAADVWPRLMDRVKDLRQGRDTYLSRERVFGKYFERGGATSGRAYSAASKLARQAGAARGVRLPGDPSQEALERRASGTDGHDGCRGKPNSEHDRARARAGEGTDLGSEGQLKSIGLPYT